MQKPTFPAPAENARTALITGGGRGIGRACALQLARAGCRVAVLARSLDEVDEVASIIHEGGGKALSAVCDVTNEDSITAAVEACTRRLGPVDILVNNAGQAHSVPLLKMSVEDWQRMINVNLTGTFLVTRAVLPSMVERGFGRVINIASTAGLTGYRYTTHYCASKHGVVGLTRALALEVASKGVTVNAVCPGWVETEMLQDTVRNISKKTGRGEENARETLLADIPTHRFVKPEAVAAMVAYVASDDARDLTGTTLTIDGGQLAG
ncbi:MAG: SDR family NAD(P)-dependent oxidoreductase [Myxococcota bacterium]